MTLAEWHSTLFQLIGLILSFFTFIGSVIAIYYTYQNLKEMKKQLNEQKNQYFEQNRGNIVFYIAKNGVDVFYSLIIKNFGNSPAKLLSLKMTPDLEWGKAGEKDLNDFNITNLKNVFLAPQQHISSGFDFSYETCGKVITENYTIDINFIGNILTMEPQIRDELSALKHINKSIKHLSDKFI